jgi:hypothetical protein
MRDAQVCAQARTVYYIDNMAVEASMEARHALCRQSPARNDASI